MRLTAEYADGTKWYRDAMNRRWPSAGTVVNLLVPDPWAGVPLESLQRAQLEGIGAHTLLHQMAVAQMGAEPVEAVELPPVPLDYPGTPDEWQQVMHQARQSLAQFFGLGRVEVIATEEPLLNARLGFAGTPDLLCRLTIRRSRRTAIVDLKRVTTVTQAHRLKLTAYSLLPGCDHARPCILHLRPTGEWALIEVPSQPRDVAALAAAAVVVRWRLREEEQG